MENDVKRRKRIRKKRGTSGSNCKERKLSKGLTIPEEAKTKKACISKVTT